MDLSYLWNGLLIGFALAAPVGPIGILCIQRTLHRGRLYGLVSGLGAATADAIYGMIAGFGLTMISDFLIHQKFWLQLIGGLFLCYLGFRVFRSHPSTDSAQAKEDGYLKAFSSILLLTITNPMTILFFMGIYTGMGILNEANSYISSLLLVTGVFVGSALWWFILSLGVSLLQDRLNIQSLSWINRLSGMLVLGFGVAALYQLF